MHRRPERPAFLPTVSIGTRRWGALGVAALALVLAGCAAEVPAATPSSSAIAPTSSATAQPTDAAPSFNAEGSAEDNIAVFELAVQDVWASDDSVSGRAYLDALSAVGFDKSAMEVTEDYSTVGNRAESIQFSVLWDGDCLVGQVGPATGDPVVAVFPAVEDGTCLVGSTRTIDW
ncbi:DUF6993 domain-containing protein (plasmid) [Coraliomargarita sp. W4R53]